MATPPTLVTEAEGTWSHTGTSETIAGVNTGAAAGRALVVLAASADSPQTVSNPTGGSLTYTLAQSNVIGSNSNTYAWTAIPSANQTFSLGLTGSSNGNPWSANVLTFSGSDGVGASSKSNGSGGPTLNITTTADNSAICVIVADWNAASGATRTWRTVNSIAPSAGNGHEKTYFTDGANYSVYGAVYPDAGTAGVKTVGLSAPTGMKYTIIAVEIKGTASGPTVQAGAASLTTSGTLNVGATVIKLGAVALSGSSTLTAAAQRAHATTSTLTAASSLTSSGTLLRPGAANLPGGSTLTAAAIATRPASASLVAGSSLTSAANRTAVSAAGLNASTSLAATAVVTRNATVTLSASSSLTSAAGGTVDAAAPLNAASTLTTVAVVTHNADASLTASSSLTAGASRTTAGAAALSADAALHAAAVVAKALASTLAASSSLQAGGSVISGGTGANLNATSALTAGTVRTATAAVTLSASGSLTAATAETALSATLTASSTLFVAATSARAATVTMTATAVLNVALGQNVTAAAVLASTTSLIATLTVPGGTTGKRYVSGGGSIGWASGEGSILEWVSGPAGTSWASGEGRV